MLTEAQKRAKQKYREKNKERTNYLNARTTARGFIRNKATIEDLEELEELIKERIEGQHKFFGDSNKGNGIIAKLREGED